MGCSSFGPFTSPSRKSILEAQPSNERSIDCSRPLVKFILGGGTDDEIAYLFDEIACWFKGESMRKLIVAWPSPPLWPRHLQWQLHQEAV